MLSWQAIRLIIMKSKFIVLMLVSLALKNINTSQQLYQLSPPLPTTAFVGQFYSCQLRVTGLNSPSFKIDGLPAQFESSAGGLIKGTPNKSGSFLITIWYSSNNYQNSRQTILRVAPSANNSKSNESQYPSFGIAADVDAFVYMVGVEFSINFKAFMGLPPYFWAYLRLPTELKGTANGTMTGTFQQEGYYSFGVVCADSSGASTQTYFSLNIQPLTFFSNYAPEVQRPIVDVPVRDYFDSSSWQQIGQLQTLATQYLGRTVVTADQARIQLDQCHKEIERSKNSLIKANQNMQTSQNEVSQCLSKRNVSQLDQQQTKTNLSKRNQTVAEKEQALKIAQNLTLSAGYQVDVAQQAKNKSSTSLQQASNNFILAQNDTSSASFNLTMAQIAFSDSQDVLSNAESAQIEAKEHLQNLTKEFEHIDSLLINAKGQVQAVKLAKDLATDIFNNRSKETDKALAELANANNKVAQLKINATAAINDVAQAKYNLQMALNRLYVAQAAKEQADKAILIINSQSMQGVSSKNLTFAGCDQGAFPSICGSATITAVIQNGYLLNSGQQLLYGDCTEVSEVAIGDIVYFEGYLRNGCIQVFRLKKP